MARKTKKKNTKKKAPPKPRNPVVEIARARNSAGYMTNRNIKRKLGRKAWRKRLEQLISGD